MGNLLINDPVESRRPAVTRLKVRSAVTLMVAVCLSMTVILIWEAWSSHRYHLRDKEVAMSNLAQALASQAQDSIKQADTLLFTLVDRLEHEGADQSRLPRLLSAQRSELSQLHGLFVFDETGRWLANSNGVGQEGLNNADREYFLFHRDHPGRGPHIGPSIKSRSSGEWVMPVSRRVNHPDGSFAGVALATIYLSHFLQLYDSIDMGSNGVINLIADNATIVIRRPFNSSDIGTSLSKSPLFVDLLPKGDAGTATIKSIIDGVDRVVGYRRVEGYPLIVFVAVNKDEVLGSWRKQTLLSAGLVSVLLVVLWMLGYRLIKLMRRQNRVQAELLGTQEKLLGVNRNLEQLALNDALTGLANRRQFDIFIESELGRARRNQTSLGLLMLDVDHFKAFNDHYGHLAGDECLRKVSAIITDNIRSPGDLAARYGGEEFAVVLPGADYVGAFLVAEKIRRAVQEANILHGDSPEGQVTVSLGLSACDASSLAGPEDLIGAADKALYVAKTSGRNMSVIAN
ncbi:MULTISPECIES: sensor domain-containing diguanylate cyclase [unclassified Pseudomonas]|uniref:sensor domain-containing diguanylate cyclase n=1 Tax=unclassified Pseudomonas TaxID=196821 RepID=UPI000BA300BB|nr:MULTISPECIES: sensor domain-containing diguanylate cyclase [unclassified Pseudomonas]MDN4544544.1 sensor domain-containing diguanylate cyclase [Pseudomonas sp. C32]